MYIRDKESYTNQFRELHDPYHMTSDRSMIPVEVDEMWYVTKGGELFTKDSQPDPHYRKHYGKYNLTVFMHSDAHQPDMWTPDGDKVVRAWLDVATANCYFVADHNTGLVNALPTWYDLKYSFEPENLFSPLRQIPSHLDNVGARYYKASRYSIGTGVSVKVLRPLDKEHKAKLDVVHKQCAMIKACGGLNNIRGASVSDADVKVRGTILLNEYHDRLEDMPDQWRLVFADKDRIKTMRMLAEYDYLLLTKPEGVE